MKLSNGQEWGIINLQQEFNYVVEILLLLYDRYSSFEVKLGRLDFVKILGLSTSDFLLYSLMDRAEFSNIRHLVMASLKTTDS